MARVLGPVGVLLGLVAVIAGVVFQVLGAAAVVYCSVIGGGTLLIVFGGATWLVHALRHRKPSSLGV